MPKHIIRKTGNGAPNGVVTPDIEGQIYIDTSSDDAYIAVGAGNTDWQGPVATGSGGASLRTKSISIEAPTDTDDITIFWTPIALTMDSVRAVKRAGTNVSWEIKFDSSRNSTGTKMVGHTTTAEAAGSDIDTFDDATVPANSYVWFEATSVSGTVEELHLTLIYTED